jgi:hypothetical protein
MAAIALALHLAGKPKEAPAATLPIIRQTPWKRINPNML